MIHRHAVCNGETYLLKYICISVRLVICLFKLFIVVYLTWQQNITGILYFERNSFNKRLFSYLFFV